MKIDLKNGIHIKVIMYSLILNWKRKENLEEA